MNQYYKTIVNGFINTIGIGTNGIAISEAEYQEVLRIVHSKPAKTATVDYMLSENMEWVPYEIEAPGEDVDLDSDEALSIIMGGNIS